MWERIAIHCAKDFELHVRESSVLIDYFTSERIQEHRIHGKITTRRCFRNALEGIGNGLESLVARGDLDICTRHSNIDEFVAYFNLYDLKLFAFFTDGTIASQYRKQSIEFDTIHFDINVIRRDLAPHTLHRNITHIPANDICLPSFCFYRFDYRDGLLQFFFFLRIRLLLHLLVQARSIFKIRLFMRMIHHEALRIVWQKLKSLSARVVICCGMVK